MSPFTFQQGQENQKAVERRLQQNAIQRTESMKYMEITYATHVKAEEQRQKLETQLNTLQISDWVASSTVLRMRSGLEAQQKTLPTLLRGFPTWLRRSPRATVLAHQVFDTPELLEHILSYLDNSDLLLAYRINHQFCSGIQGSPRLQRQLGLQAAHNSTIHFPAALSSYWLFSTDGDKYFSLRTLEGMKILLTIQPQAPITRLGTRCRSMLLCQPPISRMKVFVSCCAPNKSGFGIFGSTQIDPPPLEILSAMEGSQGITVGDVNDAVTRLSAYHRLCPDALAHDHNEDGSVRFGIELEAELEVDDTEPLWQAKAVHLRKEQDRASKRMALQHKLPGYSDAKRAARDSGLPIPTLAEFEATLVSGVDYQSSWKTFASPKGNVNLLNANSIGQNTTGMVQNDALPFRTGKDAISCGAQLQVQTLQEQLDMLVSTLGSSVPAAAQVVLSQIQRDLDTHRTSPKTLLQWARRTDTKPLDPSVAVQKVFGTPELLENILFYLPIRSVMLMAYRVNRQFLQAIEGSVKLQRRLGFQADPSSSLTLPPKELGWLRIRTDTDASGEHLGRLESSRVLISLTVDAPMTTFRTRSRSMLICQPPVHEMGAYLRCCDGRLYTGHRASKRPRTSNQRLSVKAGAEGITIGDLSDCMESLVAQHRMCPWANVEDHDEYGFVNVSARFEAELEVDGFEPLLQQKRKKREESQERRDTRRVKKARIEPYIEAKEEAFDRERPVPTLAEFEARQLRRAIRNGERIAGGEVEAETSDDAAETEEE
ncbi:hypothetical protein LTR37_002628 [Vermiconidia calcicola]|uniref:Uncharacterized protein n=1 Tax=Vermiconidia calcicola TaxID=1690605 RepID=A0ACC3NTN0_9PEZI|nr:hypothetical protein LTR37_002628 [Vermiconidia calcicola]